jgi:hypothetical protein
MSFYRNIVCENDVSDDGLNVKLTQDLTLLLQKLFKKTPTRQARNTAVRFVIKFAVVPLDSPFIRYDTVFLMVTITVM